MINKNTLMQYLSSLIVLLLSVYFVPLYVNGDQEFYIKAYNLMYGQSIKEAFVIYRTQINSAELVHFFLSWVFSNVGVGKDEYIIILNSILAFLSVKAMIKLGANNILAFFLATFGFYFWVMYIPAERLKLAIVFLNLCIIYWHSFKLRTLFVFLSCLSHLSVVIFVLIFITINIVNELKRLKLSLFHLLAVFFILGLLAYFSTHIGDKVLGYYDSSGGQLASILKLSMLLLLAMFYSPNKHETFIVMLIFSCAAFILGSGRVNMFAYFYFLYVMFQYRRGVNVLNLTVAAYFLYPTFSFFEKTILFGSTVDLYG